MEAIDGLMAGFEVAFQLENLLYVTLGVLLGTIVGLLPGLGPTAGIAVLIPVTIQMDPASAIIMLAGIYYGSMYGGRIPAILLNIPGDATAVVTTLDGYPLRQQGRAGEALGLTAIGSFIGGTIAIIGLTLLAPIAAQFAVMIGAPEMFLLALMGILMVTFLSVGPKFKALLMAGLGLLIAAIGMDPITGTPRLTFDSLNLSNGIHIVPLAVGLFGFAEIFAAFDRGLKSGLKDDKVGRILPRLADWAYSKWAILRSAVLGFFLGLIPGGGGTLSSIISYGIQKRLSKHPKKFGKGAIDGLAATETADNASSNSSFIPLLTLGIPPNPVLAVIFGALLLHNITPGPSLVNNNPDIFWGVIASMYIGNIILLVLNLPLIGVFVRILRIREGLMYPVVIIIAISGVYSVNNRIFDVLLALVFGVIGYLLKKFKFDVTPLILAFILGPILESEFRRTMLMSDGSLGIFVDRTSSLIMVALLAAILLYSIFSSVQDRKKDRLLRAQEVNLPN